MNPEPSALSNPFSFISSRIFSFTASLPPMDSSTADISRPLENLVYIELIRRGYTVRVGSFRDREVDFTVSKDGRVEYYQVCQTMLAENTRERELRSLGSIRDNFPKTVLTLDEFGLGSEDGIEVVNVIDWFLSSES